MPSLFFDVQEVQETKVSKVNKSGYAYIGRQHSGKEITWIKLKECPKDERETDADRMRKRMIAKYKGVE